MGDTTGASLSLDTVKFKQYGKLIQRFVDNNEFKELACLTAIHVLMVRLEHPQGLLMNIFNLLLEESLISSDSFLKWKNDKENLELIGVSLMSLNPFFSSLEEVDTDEEVS